MRRFACLGFVLSTVLLADPAGAQGTVTLDFHEYASATTREYPAAIGAPLVAGPLDLYDTELYVAGAANAFGTWGTADPGTVNRPVNVGSATTLFTGYLADEIDLFGRGSDLVTGVYANPFTIKSIDVAHLYSSEFSSIALASISLTIYGFGPGTSNATIQQTFTIPVPPLVGSFRYPVLQTLTFDSRWTNLYNVYWNQGSGSGTAHQFTNVVLATATAAPEPGTYLLLATGLGVLGLVSIRRRRQR